MDFTLFQLLIAFAFSLPLGFVFGLIYELFKLFHKFGFTRYIGYLITDIVFMLFCGGVTFFYDLAFIEGNTRLFVIIGEIMGFFIFSKTISPLLEKIYPNLIKFCKKIFKYLLKISNKIMYNTVNIVDRVGKFIYKLLCCVFNKVKQDEKRRKKQRIHTKRRNKRSKGKQEK